MYNVIREVTKQVNSVVPGTTKKTLTVMATCNKQGQAFIIADALAEFYGVLDVAFYVEKA